MMNFDEFYFDTCCALMNVTDMHDVFDECRMCFDDITVYLCTYW